MPKKRKSKLKEIIKKILKLILKIFLGIILLSVFSVILLKWINPVTSSIMIQRKINALVTFKERQMIAYEWFNYDDISKQMPLSVIAAEDQNFPFHFGFDFEQIGKALEQHDRGRRLRGASTITQQVAKNLFLWEGRSFIRKGLEAYFTLLIELLWSKERILEIYLNITEMGDMIFGVGAASQIYFRKTPDKLTSSQAALLAAVIPNPLRFLVRKPSSYILQRQNWILNQMSSLGGIDYLKNLYK
ncbi:MAG: monofunctional biosynthetic peptidoglycan transglycosylase [Ignavibacteriaceae bacterium]|jgi:monofunctional biosynthetic peptidoglycan transglycosylase|nr:monofunctional biosynthetic peptidoglycan transglycosylase [Ignavibacteriaceae bacterium]MCW8823999.1 monofunctional biosynthetic peptidoglycan transglycosylase [Ignavibacteriaceae bacterium]MCW8960082.1 monofunctional biosynthetic peptidoglycan transglycosylase [Ignavibacteriaceae bacterium]MCW9098120.1 monofunctional biosynthetic peptidoglycan transglycosylase [Ignavibacteriaceae bacterium]